MALVPPVIRRVFGYFRPYLRAMAFAGICAGLAGSLGAGPVLIIKHFGELMLVEKSHDVFLRLAVGVFFLPVVPLVAIVVGQLSRAIRRYARRAQAGIGQSAGLITESIAGAREVRAFGLEKHQASRFDREHDEALRQAMKGVRAGAAGP